MPADPYTFICVIIDVAGGERESILSLQAAPNIPQLCRAIGVRYRRLFVRCLLRVVSCRFRVARIEHNVAATRSTRLLDIRHCCAGVIRGIHQDLGPRLEKYAVDITLAILSEATVVEVVCFTSREQERRFSHLKSERTGSAGLYHS